MVKTEKQKRYEELLERFVDFTQKDKVDPIFRAEWLYEQINESGIFTIEAPKIVTKKHATGLYIITDSMFRNMVGVNMVRNSGVVPSTGMKSAPFEIQTLCDSNNPILFAHLGASGHLGVVFVLRFLMEVEGITNVKICEWCKRFFFPKRADRKRCYEPRTCDKDFYKSIRGGKNGSKS